MSILDFFTAQLFAQLLFAIVVAMIAFAIGVIVTLRYQRKILRSTGYTMIGSELYRAELVAEPVAEKRIVARSGRGGVIPQQ